MALKDIAIKKAKSRLKGYRLADTGGRQELALEISCRRKTETDDIWALSGCESV